MADSPSGREGGGEQDSGPEDLRSDSKKAKAAGDWGEGVQGCSAASL